MESNKTIYHITKLIYNVWQCYDNQNLIDVTFKLANPPLLVPAHRLIMSAASPYFSTLLITEQSINPVIEINNIDSDIFERLVAFCYTGTALITANNAEKMLKGAMTLKLDDVVEICVDFLLENISVFTIKRLYDLEHETQCYQLSKKILKYEINNFKKICRDPIFVTISAKRLQALVESNNLNVNCEEDVLESIERWFQHNVGDRRRPLPDLVACLRLTSFAVDILLTRIQALPGCELLAYKALSWISETSARKKISLKYTEPREGLSGNWRTKELMAIQTDCADTNHGYIFRFNKKKDTWVLWDKILINAINFEVILVDDTLFFIGGKIVYEAIKDVNSWNLKTKTWERLPDLNKARYWSSVTELDGKIYVMGGRTNVDKVSQSVEVYTKRNGWKEVCELITPRYGARAVTLNGKIFLIGGHDGCDLQVQSVERYDAITDTWTACAPLLSEHYMPGVAIHNRHIYVIGGCTQSPNAIVERYDVQADKWIKVCSLFNGRWGLGCSFIDKQLWAIGGSSQTCYKSAVTVYDTKKNKWSEAEALPRAGIYYSFTVSTTLLEEEKEIKENEEIKKLKETKELKKMKEEKKKKEEKKIKVNKEIKQENEMMEENEMTEDSEMNEENEMKKTKEITERRKRKKKININT
ncbi:kelch-like protein diablo isoform X4 [Bactrocera oleae]